MATKAFLEKAYLAYFGRPVDPTGLTDFAASTDTQVADAFAASAESKALYGTTFDYAQINAIYLALFNREAEKAGLEYWYAKVADKTFTAAGAAIAILNGAQNADKTAIENKLAASAAFSAALDTSAEMIGYSGTAAAASARAFLSTVTTTAATAAAVDAAVASAVAARTAVAGQTFTLTTGADISGVMLGSAGTASTASNDVFNAVIDQATPANSTINASDVIAGGAGTNTLNVTGVGTTLDVLNSASVSGFQTVNIRATTANSLNASAISGLTAVNSTGAGTVLVTNLAAGASIGIVGNGTLVQGEVAFAPATAASAITVNISGGVAQTAANDGITAAGTIGAGDATGTATTAVVNSTGAANTTGVIDLANATLTSVTINADTNLTADFLSQATDQVAATGTLTINGAATLVTLSAALDNDIAVINASGMTAGGISATLGTLVTQTVTGGAGADTITTSAVLTTGSVNAGAGTDTLVLANATHLATPALAAKYTNFENLRLATGLTMDMANAPAGITAVQTLGVATVSNMTATQASSVTMRANATAGTADALNLQLASQSGTSDALTITAGVGTTTTGALDIAALTVTGFEILNLRAAPGPTSTAGAGGAGDRTTNITGTITGATLREINLTGTAVNIANVATTVPVTINGSALTGDGLAAASQAGLTVGGSAVVGSTITGSAVRDVFTIGAEGSAYNGGAGNDRMITTTAILLADGTTDGTMNGGDGTDTLVVSDTTTTLTDLNFFKLSNFEALALTNTAGDASITTGGSFNAAFATGVTITTGTLAATKDINFAGGLATVPVTLTVDADLITGAATDVQSIVTGSAADTVTFSGDATYVGVTGAADQGTISITTNAGNDTISYTHGQLLANARAGVTAAAFQAVIINGGTGADTITKGTGSLNSTTVSSVTYFNMAAGDSGTTLATQDKITGFSLAGVAAGTLSDVLNFEGTATVSAFSNSADFGTILTHSITGGIVTFDTAAVFASAKIVNSSNLADVVGYLNANMAVNETVGFLFDSNSDGANDATMVFHQGSSLTSVADDLVQLVGTTGLSLNATLTTATAGAIAIA